MTFSQYPDIIAVEVLTGSSADLGDITPNSDTQLEYYGIQLFSLGAKTNEQARILCYNTGGTQIGASEYVNLNDLETTTDNFYGWVRFQFSPRFTFVSSAATRFELDLNNYTYSDSSWIAAVYDWPVTMAYNSSPNQIQNAQFAIDIYGAS